jgi:malate dehydrogenase (oxaloacetate-decarboxylating)(NADP+)
MKKFGVEALRDKKISKSTAFTRQERKSLKIRGLLPYSSITQEVQMSRVMSNLRGKTSNIEKYIFLSALQDRNERLYFQTITDNIEELLPIIYTPTVGEVCMRFSHIYRIDKGFYITPEDKGDIEDLLYNWPEENIKVIVVTDGSRILGLGDLGVNGVGISIGKLSLYTAGAGINPAECLPIVLDLGTDNLKIREDLLYLGWPHPRLKGDAYFEMVDEFIQAVQRVYPKALIQFEDFITPNAYAILNKYRDQVLCFNDDIQGTASVALAGIIASCRKIGKKLNETRVMFLGAGSAATGIADLLLQAFLDSGLTLEEAKQNIWFVDIDGLLVKGRGNLLPHNEEFAHEYPQLNFLEAVKELKPHILIGASGAGGAFNQEIIEAMALNHETPVIFALSNPTANSECTASQAYEWSKGKAVFASGSPFGEVEYGGKMFKPGQGNNVYIFPGLGLGAIAAEAKSLPDQVFMKAAHILADQVTDHDLEMGSVYPDMTVLRAISFKIAMGVAELLFDLGLAKIEKPKDLESYIKGMIFNSKY